MKELLNSRIFSKFFVYAALFFLSSYSSFAGDWEDFWDHVAQEDKQGALKVLNQVKSERLKREGFKKRIGEEESSVLTSKVRQLMRLSAPTDLVPAFLDLAPPSVLEQYFPVPASLSGDNAILEERSQRSFTSILRDRPSWVGMALSQGNVDLAMVLLNRFYVFPSMEVRFSGQSSSESGKTLPILAALEMARASGASLSKYQKFVEAFAYNEKADLQYEAAQLQKAKQAAEKAGNKPLMEAIEWVHRKVREAQKKIYDADIQVSDPEFGISAFVENFGMLPPAYARKFGNLQVQKLKRDLQAEKADYKELEHAGWDYLPEVSVSQKFGNECPRCHQPFKDQLTRDRKKAAERSRNIFYILSCGHRICDACLQALRREVANKSPTEVTSEDLHGGICPVCGRKGVFDHDIVVRIDLTAYNPPSGGMSAVFQRRGGGKGENLGQKPEERSNVDETGRAAVAK